MQYHELKNLTAKEMYNGIMRIRATGFKLERVYIRADKGHNRETAKRLNISTSCIVPPRVAKEIAIKKIKLISSTESDVERERIVMST
jgi:hypothetical protein